MRVVQLPNRDYYVQKSKFGGFIFFARAKSKPYKTGYIFLGNNCSIPKELIGKKLMLKVEVMK
jgi:hypothetical protein